MYVRDSTGVSEFYNVRNRGGYFESRVGGEKSRRNGKYSGRKEPFNNFAENQSVLWLDRAHIYAACE